MDRVRVQFKYPIARGVVSHGVSNSTMALVLYSVGTHDDVSVLWGKFAGGMSESKRDIVQQIEAHTRDEYGAVSVGALFEVLRETIEADIVRLGGKPGWVSALESIAQLSFKRIPCSVPLSAALVSSVAVDGRAAERKALAQVTPSTTNSGALKFKHPHGEKLGAYLKRTNQLSLLRLPKADIQALCKETSDFQGRLAYNDSAAVASYVFKFVCITFQDPGGCKILFKQLAEELKLIGLPWPNKGAWPEVLQRRFQKGRSSKAVSCIPAPQPASHSCRDPHHDRRLCKCAHRARARANLFHRLMMAQLCRRYEMQGCTFPLSTLHSSRSLLPQQQSARSRASSMMRARRSMSIVTKHSVRPPLQPSPPLNQLKRRRLCTCRACGTARTHRRATTCVRCLRTQTAVPLPCTRGALLCPRPRLLFIKTRQGAKRRRCRL